MHAASIENGIYARPMPPPDAFGTLSIIGRQQATITPTLRQIELYTWEGLLSLHWHGSPTARNVVVACGGAIGGTLGPGTALYHQLGAHFGADVDQDIGVIRVGYRRPNDLDACTLDVLAAASLASRTGAERFVVLGHSFGGAVAIQAGTLLGEYTAGVVTLATQSAGCEVGEKLAADGVPVLLLHGDNDDVLPFFASQLVQMLTGGELVILPGASHGLSEVSEELRDRLLAWIPPQFSSPRRVRPEAPS